MPSGGLLIPPELKKITPIIRRAEELEKSTGSPESQFVAFYCYQYAVHKGITLPKSDEGTKTLGSLLTKLEGQKEKMNEFTVAESKMICLKFANKVFEKADAEDRAGTANLATSKTFYAAGTFFEIMHQFYQDDDESEELAEIKKKQVYAKWKALEINKAIKAGEKPTPGGYAENVDTVLDDDDDDGAGNEAADASEGVEISQQDGGATTVDTSSIPESSVPSTAAANMTSDDSDDGDVEDVTPTPAATINDDGYEDKEEEADEGTEVALGPPPAYPMDLGPPPPAMPSSTLQPPPPAVNKPPLTFNVTPTPPPPVPVPVPPKKKTGFLGLGGGSSKKVSKAQIDDATELTRFALKALQDKDTDLAVQRLKDALKFLGH